MTTKHEDKDSDMSQCATISAVSVDDVTVDSTGQEKSTSPLTSGFTDFDVPGPDQLPEVAVVIKKKKQPKRILHFSDGTLEEYSTDEDETDEAPKTVIDPKTLSWASWMWYYTSLSAAKVLGVADTCGEKLAWFFGITSPKYQYAIDEYDRMKEEEEEEKKQMEREAAAEWARVNHAMSQESITTDGSTSQRPVQLDQPRDLPSLVATQPKF